MSTYENNKKILRELAREYAQIANLDTQKKRIENWKAIHGLKEAKPVVIVDQVFWPELEAKSEFLQLKCTDEVTQTAERFFRKTIYQWKFFPGDMVVKPYYPLQKKVNNSGIGIASTNQSEEEHQEAQSHLFEDMLPDEDALEKLVNPVITYDKVTSEKEKEILEEYFGDILPVELVGTTLWEAIWDRIVFYRGATPVLYDLMDEPEYLHKLMTRLMEIEHVTIDQMEKENLFQWKDAKCHCIETYCDDLPVDGYDPMHVRAKDCWVAGAAQIFSEVSPEMHNEFEIEYLKSIYERFGLVNYGCCEPLHNKIDLVRKIKNVRAISISPWADVKIACEQMQNDYVMARKPNPAFLAGSTLDEESIRKEARYSIDCCRESKTPLMLILKDLTTIRSEPERLTRWCEIVNEEINR